MQTNYTPVIGPPQANGTVLQSGTNPLVSVKPNATDVFYVAASALMGVIGNGCGRLLKPQQTHVQKALPAQLMMLSDITFSLTTVVHLNKHRRCMAKLPHLSRPS